MTVLPVPVEPVVGARVSVLRAPTSDGLAMSFAALPHRTMVLVELYGASGTVGVGESWVNFPPWAAHERVATLRDGVLPLLLERTADTVQETQQRLLARLDPLGRQWGAPGPIRQAVSAVDVALWDLAGRASQQPVSELAGGAVRKAAHVYASSLGPSDVAAAAARCRQAGHTAVKVKLGFGRANDAHALREARRELGDDVELYVDANQAWTLTEAVAMAPLLRETGAHWVEEPIRGDRLADLEELHRRTGLAIATGENVYGLDEFHALAQSPAVAVLQPDITKTGGLTEVFAVCRLAAEAGKPVLPHLYGGALGYAATLQLAAAMAVVGPVEYDIRDNPLRDPLLVEAPTPAGDTVRLPSGPGLGVELDERTPASRTEESYLTGTVTAAQA